MRLFDQWINDTPLKTIALKAIHVMPACFCKNQVESQKTRDHLVALETRLKL